MQFFSSQVLKFESISFKIFVYSNKQLKQNIWDLEKDGFLWRVFFVIQLCRFHRQR